MGEHGMTPYYKEKFQAGLEYQDFISDKLRKADPCIIIGSYASRRWQNEHGESMSGIEIKYDMRMKNTGNLYIEVAEKSRPEIREFTPSGIMRNDHSWLYLVGDYERAFLFNKRQLQMTYIDKDNYGPRGIKLVEIETSQGFLLPIRYARNGLCLREFVFEER